MLLEEETEAGRALGAALHREGVRGRVHTDALTRVLYATDASNHRIVPDAVLVAAETEDLAAAMAACRATGVPVTARGAGTSLAGQTVGRGLHLDTSLLSGFTIDASSRTAEAWCGTVQRSLDLAAGRHGLTFGPETATANRATLGGMVGNDSAGTRSIVYGLTRDRLAWIEAVLADGSVVRFGADGLAEGAPATLREELTRIARLAAPLVADRWPTLLRHVDGYGLDELASGSPNLARFLAGSEGTLALFTRFGLELDDLPAERALAVCSFGSLEDALEAVPEVLAASTSGPATLSAVELLDRFAFEHDRSSLTGPDAQAVLFVEFQGEASEAVQAALSLSVPRALETRFFDGPAEQARAWAVRERGLGAMQAISRPGTLPAFIDDTAVPPEHLSEYVSELRRIVASYDTNAVMFGHASVGCLHIYPLLDARSVRGVEDMESMASEIVDLVRSFGGAVSGEHGDGLSKSQWLERSFGEEIVGLFRRVKDAFDPDRLLNPGKIVDAEPMTSHLRYGPGYRVRPGWSAEEATAIETCFGAGACRKTGHGVMCPPAMVTGLEEHTTRARANALRGVMQGALPVSSLSGERMREVMGTCVACKACASECPVGVDMAALKTDWLSRVGSAEGFSYQARMLAHLRLLARAGSVAPRVANTLTSSPLVRRALGRAGLAPERSLPTVAARRFSASVPRRAQKGASVAIFADCFTEHFEPQVGRAMLKLLHASGRRAEIASVGCCGRPAYSSGLVEVASRQATRTASRLARVARRGLPIALLEPSCLSMVRDEWSRLVPRGNTVAEVREMARSAEELLGEIPEAPWMSLGGDVVVQPHCHERSLWSTEATATVVGAGSSAEVLDAGCCGMAGGFGYDAHHYEMSVAIGERAMVPALRERPDAEIVAAGHSCRHQIRDLTGREALHPAEYLARRLR